MFMNTRTSGYNELVGSAIHNLDVPDDVYIRMRTRYRDVASFVADYLADYAGRIYTQGSVRLGTIVAPVDPHQDHDIDLVCLVHLLREQVTKKQLKDLVGQALRAYVATNPEGRPRVEPGKRCWTLIYPNEQFHMDVLPAIPNDEKRGHTIWITDRKMHEWQPSNPIGYADWFRSKMHVEYKTLREALASRGIDIEDAPPSEAKTNLQLTTQALKRHRDIFFLGHATPPPATVILTTLAGHAYEPAETLLETLAQVTTAMPDFIENRDGTAWVPNPAMETENFAHRWEAEPARARTFERWIAGARADFAGFQNSTDTGSLLESVKRSLGDGPAKHAGAKLGQRLNRARRTGIGLTPAGALTTAPAHAAPSHTFHGGPSPTHNS